MGLLEELRADQSRGGQVCKTCVFIESQPAEEQHIWREAFADRSFSTASLARAIRKRDAKITESAVYTHREKHR